MPKRQAKDSNQRPDRDALIAAVGRTVPDVIGRNLRVLFCGINPGLYSAAIGHHFGRPGNRFWPALYQAGFTDRLLSAPEEQQLLKSRCGITNLVARATATADELTRDELVAGGQILLRKVKRLRPQVVAVLGISAYRVAFQQPKVQLGAQEERLGTSRLWVLPNPSGLNAHYQLPDLVQQFRLLNDALLPHQ